MAQQFEHHVQVRVDDNKSIYKMMLWCGKHIAPNYDLWLCNPNGWDSSMDEVVFMFADKQHACEFALIWS